MERPAQWCGVITLFSPHEEKKSNTKSFGLVFLTSKNTSSRLSCLKGKERTREQENPTIQFFSNSSFFSSEQSKTLRLLTLCFRPIGITTRCCLWVGTQYGTRESNIRRPCRKFPRRRHPRTCITCMPTALIWIIPIIIKSFII